MWLSGPPAGHCLCVGLVGLGVEGMLGICGRNVGEFVSAQMEANCIQSDS